MNKNEDGCFYVFLATLKEKGKKIWKLSQKIVYLSANRNSAETPLSLMDLQTHQQVSDNVRIVYLQLPLFNKHTEEECKDIFDCWIYIIKNMNMFEQMPFRDKYPVFRKLAQIGDLRKLSQEERALYDEDIKNMRDLYATNMFERRQEKIESAKRYLAMGLTPEQVAQGSDLPLDEVLKLAQSN